jgi:hypothetical protein
MKHCNLKSFKTPVSGKVNTENGAYLDLAIAWHNAGDVEGAMRLLDLTDKRLLRWALVRADLLRARGAWSEAMEWYLEAIRREPHFCRPRIGLALIYLEHRPEAIPAHFADCLTLCPCAGLAICRIVASREEPSILASLPWPDNPSDVSPRSCGAIQCHQRHLWERELAVWQLISGLFGEADGEAYTEVLQKIEQLPPGQGDVLPLMVISGLILGELK